MMIQVGKTWWMYGFDTGTWFRYDGVDWVKDTPPGLAPPSGEVLHCQRRLNALRA